MAFLRLLFPKLWPHKCKLIRDFPTNPIQNSLKICFFCHNFGTKNARKLIKGSKASYYSLVPNKTEPRNWLIGSAEDIIEKNIQPTQITTSATENPKPKNLSLWELVYEYIVCGFRPKTSNYRLPYQHHSSFANCAGELFKGSNRSASLLVCTRKKFFWLGVAHFLWVTS